jgi:phosphoribosylanthranilate isomerase
MTRAVDAAAAVGAGADYIGVIFAGGPRNQSLESAAAILASVAGTVRRVGVFGTQDPQAIAAAVEALSLDVVQLHGDPTPARIAEVRRAVAAEIWAVVRLGGSTLPAAFAETATLADAVVFDALVPGGLGGSGVVLPWTNLASALEPWRDHTRIVLAGGLRPENVSDAVAAIRPDVVDVSSGIESAPGIKDHQRMRAFRDRVHSAAVGE